MQQEISNHDNIHTSSIVNEDVFFIQHIKHTPSSGLGVAIPPIHRHPYYEIVLVTSGEGLMQIDFKEYTLKRGVVCLFSPSQIHQPIISSEDYSAYLLRFYPSVFDNKEFFGNISIFDTDYFILDEEDYGKRYNFLKDLLNEFNEDHPMKKFALGNLLKCFLISLQRIIPEAPKKKPTNDLFSQLNTLIVENNFQIHLPSYYAKKLRTSTRTLNTVIKEFTGLSSRDYISSPTLLEAKRLLNYTNLSIKEIAHNLGFEDSAYFSRFFKQATKKSPIAFRESNGVS